MSGKACCALYLSSCGGQQVDLKKVVEHVCDTAGHLLKPRVSLEKMVDQTTPLIAGDGSRIVQVCLLHHLPASSGAVGRSLACFTGCSGRSLACFTKCSGKERSPLPALLGALARSALPASLHALARDGFHCLLRHSLADSFARQPSVPCSAALSF